MRVPYNWLKDYVDFDLSPPELANRLTMIGLEVEAIEEVKPGFEGVVVGKILSVERHPSASGLMVCWVDVGAERLPIICGAPNVREEEKVAVALQGAKLPDNRIIKRRRFKGLESAGMICSEAELGLGDDRSGIMVLPEGFRVGAPLDQALGLCDVILDLEVTPNRPDCMSLIGVAREVSVVVGKPLKLPGCPVEEGSERVEELAAVEIEDTESCPRYSARVVRGVRVGPSPAWLARRLEMTGLRPINNVVDVTNYVLMELGHPLHAFDLDRLSGRRIIVRRAAKDEVITTLDSVWRRLDEDILVIADAERPVAVAGVMGGMDSEVTDQTKDVLLESAYFHPPVVRAGAKKLDLSTEASQRFERGADFNATVGALDRAARLIAELSGGVIARGVIDQYPKRLSPPRIRLRPQRIGKILGVRIPRTRVESILTSLGCEVFRQEDTLQVCIPSFRPDLTREIDLIEEVARIYGYDRIPADERVSGSLGVEINAKERMISRIRDILTGLGMTEVVTSSLIDPAALDLFVPATSWVRISNPASHQMSVLRPALLPSLLEVTAWNLNRKVEGVKIFEVGRVFCSSGSSGSSGSILERIQVGGAITGVRKGQSWGEGTIEVDFFDIKGIVEMTLERIGCEKVEMRHLEDGIYESSQAVEVYVDGQGLGTLGMVSPDILARFDMSQPVYGFSLDLDALLNCCKRGKRYRPLPRFPAAHRDIAVIVDDHVEAEKVAQVILSVDPILTESVDLFDVYRGGQIPAGKKSLAFSLRFRSPERTLSDEEVDQLFGRIVDRLQKDFGARLRSKHE
ncbi:MAG TPA: phenylalanine--tRNA ligase subunit beta [Candidatus Latescibacteria bacterium]|nr:phenylalanine--tRNA ligase subunit beta [Candidatus Latescibacterota bacterium]